MVRVDEEATSPVVEAIRNLAAEKLELLIDSDMPPEVVLIEDYNKGLLTLETIERVLTACDRANIPVAVDPKLEQFTAYRGVALFKPNLKELNEGLQLATPVHPDHRDSMECAVETLMDTLQCERLMVTLGEHGTWLHAPEEQLNHVHLPALKRDIVDVSGAGDTVISVAAMLLACGVDSLKIASIANLAGGWGVSESVWFQSNEKRSNWNWPTFNFLILNYCELAVIPRAHERLALPKQKPGTQGLPMAQSGR